MKPSLLIDHLQQLFFGICKATCRGLEALPTLTCRSSSLWLYQQLYVCCISRQLPLDAFHWINHQSVQHTSHQLNCVLLRCTFRLNKHQESAATPPTATARMVLLAAFA
jgi:hypothetical protein